MKITLAGYGKMGKTVEALAKEMGYGISYIIDKDNQIDFSLLTSENTDAVIEFSEPLSAYENVKKCLSAGVNVISGTTGWEVPADELTELCLKHNTAFIHSTNYNLGTHLFFYLNRIMAEKSAALEYLVSINEIHHVHKKDKPSGTAITLANNIISESTLYNKWELAEDYEKSVKGTIHITSQREGEVTGIHTSEWISEHDIIELSHIARNRKGFAAGALLAASILKGKKGYFTMNDILTEIFKI